MIIKKVVFKVVRWIKKEILAAKKLEMIKNNKNIKSNKLLIRKLHRLNITKTHKILKTEMIIIKLWNLMKVLSTCQMTMIYKKSKTMMKYVNLMTTKKILIWLN